MSMNKQALQQAQTLHQQGKLNEALAAYQTLHQQTPENIEIIQLMVLCLVQKNQLKQAKSLLAKLIKKLPNEASLYNTLGNVLSRQKKDREAQTAYEQAIQIAPEYPGALSNLGNCHYRCGDLEKAKSYYQKAIAIDDDYPDAHFNLARLLTENGELNAAKPHLAKAIQIASHHAGAHGLLASIYLQTDEDEKAIEHLKKRLNIQPQHLDSYQTLATALMQHQRYNEAVDVLEKLLTLNPKQAEAEHLLGTAYLGSGQREKALQHYLRQLEQAETLDTLYNIAVILSDQQRHKEAIDYFHRALKISDNHLPSLLNLAALYLKNQDSNQAITTYQQALAIDPDNAEVKHILHAISGDSLPEQAPKEYVSHLFDQYAPSYDKHLTDYLEYQVPHKIHQAIMTAINPKDHSLKILDLGCGTGLSGAQFAYLANYLVGIDLSSAMLEIAKQKNIYQALIHGAIEEELISQQGFDLVLAADVFPYFGDLSKLFQLIHRALNKSGLLAFSIERTLENNFILQKNIRYAHNKEYISQLAEQQGFSVLEIENTVLRKQQGKAVEGYIVILTVK